MHHIAHACFDHKRKPDEWFIQGENCDKIDLPLKDLPTNYESDKIVFTVLMPHKGLEMSRWHQFIVGVMSIEIGNRGTPRKYCCFGVSLKDSFNSKYTFKNCKRNYLCSHFLSNFLEKTNK